MLATMASAVSTTRPQPARTLRNARRIIAAQLTIMWFDGLDDVDVGGAVRRNDRGDHADDERHDEDHDRAEHGHGEHGDALVAQRQHEQIAADQAEDHAEHCAEQTGDDALPTDRGPHLERVMPTARSSAISRRRSYTDSSRVMTMPTAAMTIDNASRP